MASADRNVLLTRFALRTAGVDIEAGSPEAMRLIMAGPVRSGIDLIDRIGFRPQ